MGGEQPSNESSERVLSRQAESFRNLAEHATDLISRFDRELRYLYVNPGIEKSKGLSREQLIGRTSRETGLPGELADLWEKALRQVFATRVEAVLATTRPGPEGLEYYESRFIPEFDSDGTVFSVLVVIQDVTSRRQAEEALRESEDRFRVAIRHSRLLVSRSDRDLRYRWAFNPHTDFVGPHTDFVGLSVLGKRDDEIEDSPGSRQLLALKRRVVESGAGAEEEISFARSDGVRTYQCIIEPLFGSDGAVTGTTNAAIDVTERKRAEEALRLADRQKDAFLALMAHELRNPLAAIHGAVALASSLGPPEPERRWIWEVVERQTGHMKRLLDDLLDIARMSQGRIAIHPERLEVRRLIDQAVEMAGAVIQARKHHLAIAPLPAPLLLHGDATRLIQVLANLLDNAAKYTPEGGHISLTTEATDDQVIFRVRDDGIGIAPEAMQSLFQPFELAGRRPHAGEGGLGVGLALVRELARLHGGTVEARSEGPGRGSEFTVRLPRLVAPPPEG